MRVTEQGTLYKQMIQNMRSLCGGAQPMGMLVGVGRCEGVVIIELVAVILEGPLIKLRLHLHTSQVM